MSPNPLFKQSLEMRRRVLAPNHPDIARSLHYYGNMVKSLRSAADARPLLEECVAIRRMVLPSDHPYLGQSLALLGHILTETSDFDDALPLLEESREILAAQLHQYFPESDRLENYRGEKYGNMAGMALEPENLIELDEYLSICLTELGRYREAETRLQSALRDCQMIFGVDHQRTNEGFQCTR